MRLLKESHYCYPYDHFFCHTFFLSFETNGVLESKSSCSDMLDQRATKVCQLRTTHMSSALHDNNTYIKSALFHTFSSISFPPIGGNEFLAPQRCMQFLDQVFLLSHASSESHPTLFCSSDELTQHTHLAEMRF